MGQKSYKHPIKNNHLENYDETANCIAENIARIIDTGHSLKFIFYDYKAIIYVLKDEECFTETIRNVVDIMSKETLLKTP